MKIVTFWGGLGNQIFEYAYYQWLKNRYPMENIYAYYPTLLILLIKRRKKTDIVVSDSRAIVITVSSWNV